MVRAMNDSVMSTMRWTGLALYTLSFFLYAVGSQPPEAPQLGGNAPPRRSFGALLHSGEPGADELVRQGVNRLAEPLGG